jgi:eukaryotic-like serine/threonine-protein kinase
MSNTDAGQKRVFGNRYEIESKIARGGMADVFLANDTLLDRPVALKVLFPELSVDPSFVERFRREAQNAAKLSHPNIVSVYDWGEDNNTYFIVMEYLDGKSLSTMLRERGSLPAEEAAKIGEEVAAALSFAHRHDVVHRDVKPGNVLIDQRGAVKVTDFGIARARNTTENLTQTGAVMGTATYFSPEQAQGLDVDQRSDVYSLGVVLYEMTAGRPPFQGDNPVTIAYKHVRENPEPLGDVNSLIPKDYQSIVAQAMTKAPANRYQTAEDLRADLARFGAGQPVHATPLSDAPTATQAGRRTVDDAYAQSTRTIPSATRATRTAPPISSLPKDRDHKSFAIPLMVFLSLVAVIGIAALLIYGGVFDREVKQVQVPALVGKSLDEAKAELNAQKLGYTVDRQTNDKPIDTVLAQDPKDGTIIPSTQRIKLTVSSGPAAVSVPDVTNQTVETATKTLQGLGFTVKTSQATSDTYDKGRVISQDPASGASGHKGDTINLVVSSGGEQVEVPDVSGYTVSRAAQQLSDAGLRTSTPPGAGNTDLVSGTNPPSGTKVDRGTTITLMVPSTSTSSSSSSTSSSTSSTSTTSTTKP